MANRVAPPPHPSVGMDDPRWYAFLQQLGRQANVDPTELPSLVVGGPTGGNQGDGTVNAEELYEDGKRPFIQGGDAEAGLTFTAFDHGTVTSGTITPNPLDGLKQTVTNNGAFTIAATSQIGDVELRIINGASAGAITFSGFTKNWTGDGLDTTNTNQFIVFIYGYGTKSAYLIKALQ